MGRASMIIVGWYQRQRMAVPMSPLMIAYGLRFVESRRHCHYWLRPWQFLYFLPDPQGQGSLRPMRGPALTGIVRCGSP